MSTRATGSRRAVRPALVAVATAGAFATLSLPAARADDAASPGVSAAPPVRDLGAPGPSVAERLAEIRRRVQAVADYPALARARGVEGETLVGLEIDARGRAVRVAVESSSGSRALDRAAERAVGDAGTLPYVTGRIRVPVRFRLVGADAPEAGPPAAAGD